MATKSRTPTNDWAKLMQALMANVVSSVNVSGLGRVINTDSKKMADVQILGKTGDKKPPTIFNTMLLDNVTDLKVGDVVLLIYTDVSLSDYSGNGQIYDVKSTKRHSINNAVIVGRLA